MNQYWITDLGQSLELVPNDGGAPRGLGRYGIWEARNGKAQCIVCSDDLDALRVKYGLPANAPVHPIVPPNIELRGATDD